MSDLYTGPALAQSLTSSDPNWVNGTPQHQTFDLNQLPSGTYHLWFEADNGNNLPVRSYMTGTIVVDHAASWPVMWTAALTVTPAFRELDVQWLPHPHPDVDGYVLILAAPDLTTTQVITVGSVTVGSFTALQPGLPYSITVQAYNTAHGLVSQSQTVIGIPESAPFTLTGPTGAINLIAGQSQATAVTLATDKEPYPTVIGLQLGCVHLSSSACDSSLTGFSAGFAAAIVTPTLAGVNVQVEISAMETVPAGNYVVPIIAQSDGLSHTLEVAITIKTQDIAVTAPAAVTLGRDQVLDLPITTAGANGASTPIGLHVDNAPVGLLWSLDQDTVLPGGSASLIITDTELLASGTYTVAVSGDDGLHRSTAYMLLTVSKPRFQLVPVTVEQVIEAGDVTIVTFALDIVPYDGWTAPVTLAVDPTSVPALGSIGLASNPATDPLVSSVTISPTERVYLVAVTQADMPSASLSDRCGGCRRKSAANIGSALDCSVTTAVRSVSAAAPSLANCCGSNSSMAHRNSLVAVGGVYKRSRNIPL